MEIAYTLSDNSVVMSTAMVASILILNRKGGTNEEDLLSRTTWLYHEIAARNGLMSMSVPPSVTTLRTVLVFLKDFIKRKQDVFVPQVKAKEDYKNILMLANYRNNLIQVFLNESYIATAILAFGETITETEGVTL